MKGAIIHGVLLVLMLGFAYQTWTRDTSVKPSTGSVVLWNEKVGDIESIVLETPDRTARIERRGDGAASYFWGTDIKVTKKAKPKAKPQADAGVAAATDGGVAPVAAVTADGGVAPAADAGVPEIEYETSSTTREFPVGEVSLTLLPGWSSMRAIESLGVISDDDKAAYKLDEADKTLTVVYKSGTRSFILGGKAFGGKSRYVLEVETGKGYILDGSLIAPLEEGESGLRPKQIIPVSDNVASIEISAGDKTKKVSRITVVDEAGKSVKTWGDLATKKADQTAANFLTKIETSFKPTKFEPALDVKTLTELVTVTYRDAKGATLSTLHLYKREAPPEAPPPNDAAPVPPVPPGPTTEYFVVTDATRVPAVVAKTAGDQVEQNVATVFE